MTLPDSRRSRLVQELRHDEFRFPRHRQVGSRSQGVFGEMEGPGAPHNHGLAPPFAFLDGLHDAVMLDDHPGDENQVALFPVLAGRYPGRSDPGTWPPTLGGSRAATVSRPKGGMRAFFPSIFKTRLKDQNDWGCPGLTKRTFNGWNP